MELFELQELLKKYRQGITTPEETRLINAWFFHTENEPATLSATERTEIAARVLNKIHYGISPERRSLLQYPLIRIAAMFILLAGSATAVFQYRFSLLNYFDPIKQVTVQSGPYEIKQVLLPDSTIIALHHNSSISYPARYRGPQREVLLRGKGYFQVAGNPQYPFVVHTGSIDIQVLGTSFVVTDQPGDSIADVSVLTGKVNVSHEQRSIAVLTPSKGVSFNKTNNTSFEKNIAAAQLVGWVDKQLLFDTTSLPQVFKALEARYNLMITVKGNTIYRKVFTGEFNSKDSLTDILDIITVSSGLKYQYLNDSTINIYK